MGRQNSILIELPKEKLKNYERLKFSSNVISLCIRNRLWESETWICNRQKRRKLIRRHAFAWKGDILMIDNPRGRNKIINKWLQSSNTKLTTLSSRGKNRKTKIKRQSYTFSWNKSVCNFLTQLLGPHTFESLIYFKMSLNKLREARELFFPCN